VNVKIYIPHPALKEFVLNISTVHVELPGGITDVITPYPPSPFQSLMFYCNDPVAMSRSESGIFDAQPLTTLVGPQFSRVNIKVHKVLKAIRVDFTPGGMYRMLGIPMHEMFDEGFDATIIFDSGIKSLSEALQNIADLEEGKNHVEKFLLNQVRNCKAIMPIDSALSILLKHEGSMSVEHAASLSCLSIKQFERRCKERLGMNPKLYTRILRFSKAYRLHEANPQLNWTAIAHQAGYYDQMHMIRDFKVFAGVNPSVIQHQLLNTPLRMQKDLPW
jgi:AraC-like DNA-binding protein